MTNAKGLAARAVLALALLLTATAGLAAQAEWIYLGRGNHFAVIDPETGDQAGGGVLTSGEFRPDGSATPEVVPTPGGRYVFFFYPDDDAAIVVDAETHQVAWGVRLPYGSERLQFSSMGDSVYVQASGSRVALPHRQGQLTGSPAPAPSVEPGGIAFNRRATRIYGERDGRLVYLLAHNGEQVAEVRLSGGPHDWQSSPNFRFLVGAAKDGSSITLVDEQRARAVGRLTEQFVPGSVRFTESSGEVYFLGAGGNELVTADVRHFRVTERKHVGVVLQSVWRVGTGAYHGISPEGSLVLDASGSTRTVRLDALLPGPGVVNGSLVVLRPGAGFACF